MKIMKYYVSRAHEIHSKVMNHMSDPEIKIFIEIPKQFQMLKRKIIIPIQSIHLFNFPNSVNHMQTLIPVPRRTYKHRDIIFQRETSQPRPTFSHPSQTAQLFSPILWRTISCEVKCDKNLQWIIFVAR